MSDGQRILFASSIYPWPESSGTRHRLSTIVDSLVSMGPVDYVTLGDRQDHSSPRARVRVFTEVENHPSPGRRWSEWLLSGDIPFAALPYRARALTSRISHLIRRGEYGAVWVHRLELWPAIRLAVPPSVPIVIDADDLPTHRVQDLLRSRSPASAVRRKIRRMFLSEELRRYHRLLDEALSQAIVALANPSHVGALGHPRAALVRNGVRLLNLDDGRRWIRPGHRIGFVGHLNYPPNGQAALRIGMTLASELRRVVPETEVVVIGRLPPALAGVLTSAGVKVAGYVPDLTEALSALDAMIIPLSSGSGTRIKAIDAMARGLPIVSTTLGVDGLPLRAGTSVLIGESDQELAAHWGNVVRDRAMARSLAEQARLAYEQELSPEAVAGDVQAALSMAGWCP